MSFKKFSVSQSTASNNKAKHEAKATTTGGKPAAQPAKKQEKSATARKS